MFKALSSTTRVEIIKSLLRREMHISAIARELKISVPVASKHVKVLEKAGLVEKREYGRSQVLKAKPERLYEMFDIFSQSAELELKRGTSILDALKSTCNLDTKTINEKEFLISINGKEGYYLYEVDGKIADYPMDRYKIRNDVEFKLKKLIPITERKVKVKLK
jgi:DNA-binding transcriptional ArsR family regulator